MNVISTESALKKILLIEKRERELVVAIKENYGFSYLSSQVLANRCKFEDIENFIEPKIKNSLPDTALLPDIQRATEMILHAINNNKTIGILGDYDVDGISASLMWQEFLEKLNISTKVWLPNRTDGYGPSDAAIEFFTHNCVDLLILVDCGSSAHDFFEKYKKKSIIIDHHKIENNPKCEAIINPHRIEYDIRKMEPFLNLCAAGLSFLTIYHTLKFYNLQKQSKTKIINSLIDLAALGTICDIMPLDSFNRTIIKKGLSELEKQQRPGIRYMMQLTKTQLPLTTQDISFFIGPRLNAAGRMKRAKIAFDLLAENKEAQALKLAQEVEILNKERKDLQSIIFQEALIQAQKQQNNKIILLASESWHMGVIGIIAAMVQENMNKPVIIGNIEGEIIKASARSNFLNIGQIIQNAVNEKIINSGGGHAKAGGLQCTTKQWENLNTWIEKNVEEVAKAPKLIAQAQITLEQIDDDFKKLGPFGPENEEIIIYTKHTRIKQIQEKETHIRIIIEQNFKSYIYFLHNKDSKLICALKEAFKLGKEIDLFLQLSEKNFHKIKDFIYSTESKIA